MKKFNSLRINSKKIAILLFLLNTFMFSKSLYGKIIIPDQGEWIDRGIVLKEGSHGEWDKYFGGMISPCSVVKKNGTFYLYYIGADGLRSTDGGPRHRALGVATSTDGFKFIKYKGNPIIKYLPHNNEEEGIFSAAATLNKNGNVVLYYGGMDAGSSTSTTVDSDIRLAVSPDGFHFTEHGDVLSHSNISVWGFGDEIFPVGTFFNDGRWYVYYIAKGYSARWDLGLASGLSMFNLKKTSAVLMSGSFIVGGCDPIWIDSGQIALFVLRDFKKKLIEIRITSINSPWDLSLPVKTYDFDKKVFHNTIFYDNELKTWFMYHLRPNKKSIRVMTAPGPKINSNAVNESFNN